jgi:hypothetical protein
MIYKFRVFSDINEKFLRCIEIDENDTFLSLHDAIQKSVNFTKKEMCSFYLSNDTWDRLTQFTLMDVRDGEADDVFSMENTVLSEFVTEEGENLVYVYDFIFDRVFYLELSEIKNQNKMLTYPLCSQSIGEAPQQVLSEKRVLKGGVIAGKVISNIKKPAVVTGKIIKPVKDAKKALIDVKAKKAEPIKPVKVVGKPTLEKVKLVEKGTSKSKLVDDKKASSKVVAKAKKSKVLDDDDLDLDDDDLLDDETPVKAGKKVAAKSSRSRSVDDDDDDDDDDSAEDDLVDDVDEEEEEDFGFDEDEIDTKFKSSPNIFASFDDEDDVADDYDDPLFDNIDDYADRL